MPAEPRVSRAQFEAIRQYYLSESTVLQYQPPELKPKPPVSPLFDPITVPIPATVVTMDGIDPLDHALHFGTATPASLLFWQKGVLTSNQVPSGTGLVRADGPDPTDCVDGEF